MERNEVFFVVVMFGVYLGRSQQLSLFLLSLGLLFFNVGRLSPSLNVDVVFGQFNLNPFIESEPLVFLELLIVMLVLSVNLE